MTVIEGDLRAPDSILEHPDTRRLIDFDEPLGLVIVAVWLFVSDDDRPYGLMARYRNRLASGSYVAMSHASLDEVSDEMKEMMAAVGESYDETADPYTLRGREQFTAFFDGFTILDPGVVYLPDWRPVDVVDTDDPARPCNFGAVAGKS